MKVFAVLALLIVFFSCKSEKQRIKEDFDKTEKHLDVLQNLQRTHTEMLLESAKHNNGYAASLHRGSLDSLKPTIDSLLVRLEYLSTRL